MRGDGTTEAGVELDLEHRAPAACPLPGPWDLTRMAGTDLDPGLGLVPEEVRVLAWQQTKDERPLFIDSALLWARSSDGRYWLAHLYRHPKDPVDRAWHRNLAYASATPAATVEITRAPPTHEELETYITETRWTFGPEDAAFHLLAGMVCERAWSASFQEPPWHAYDEAN